MTALMRIDVGGSTGTNDTSRTDGVPNTLVTLTFVGTPTPTTYLWQITQYTGSFTVPTISNSTTSVATFTPNGGASGYGQSFLITLTIDSGLGTQSISSRALYIATQNKGLILPLFTETASPNASLQNNGSTFIAASTDNSASNYTGYHQKQINWEQQYERVGGGSIYLVSSPSSISGNTTRLIASAYLPVCTVGPIHAYLGAANSGDTAFLVVSTTGGSTVATLSVTGSLQDVSYTTPITVSSTQTYLFQIYGSAPTSVTNCYGIYLNIY